MKTANEMRSFAAKYTITNRFIIGVKLENCPFEDIEATLKPDEEVLFCFGAMVEVAVALTNYRLIHAVKNKSYKLQFGGLKFFSYDNINSVSSENKLIHIKTIGDEDLEYGNFHKETIGEAVTAIEDIIKEIQRHRKSGFCASSPECFLC